MNRDPVPGDALVAVLTAAAARGLIGGGDLAAHIRHAEAFVGAVGATPANLLDLGSGGGLPGLVLARCWPTSSVTLLDGSSERARFLRGAVDRLGLAERARVAEGRAEDLARDPGLRGRFDVVVSRAFGPPAVVAECAAGFLVPHGRVVVSEPPGSDGSRWDHPEALARLGLAAGELRSSGGVRFQVLEATAPCPQAYPRRVGIPTKRPLF